MGSPAARMSDPTAHGGMITTGSPNVFVGLMPAARIGDDHLCPLHGAGPIKTSSATVIINGRGAARKDDQCLCMVPADVAGAGEGWKAEGVKFTAGGKGDRKYGERDKEYSSLPKQEGEEKSKGFDPKLKAEIANEFYKTGSTNADGSKRETGFGVYEASGTAAAGVEGNDLRNLKAEAGVKGEVEGTAYRAKGEIGDDKHGASADLKVLTAKADASAGGTVQTKDGVLTDAYVGAEAGAGASVVEGKLKGNTGFTIPFTKIRVGFEGEASGALLTVEARAQAHAGLKDGKFSIGMGAKVGAALAGLGFSFNMTISREEPEEEAKKDQPVVLVPGIDPIAMGYPTVLIGMAAPPVTPMAPPPPAAVGPLSSFHGGGGSSGGGGASGGW